MKQRLITTAILLCILAPVLFLSGTVLFPVVATLFCAIALYEMLGCLGTRKKLAIAIPSILMSGMPLLLLTLVEIRPDLTVGTITSHARMLFLLLMAAILVLFMFYLFAAAVFSRHTFSFSEIAATYMTTFYIVLSFSAIPLIRFGVNGQYYYLLCFLGPWVTDSFAFLSGYFFGKRKLVPEISPKKTVEGSIGGTLFCMLAFVGFGFVVGGMIQSTPNYLMLILLGFSVAVLAQIGDLSASLIKREHDVKDYGHIFPGHGGVMDRFDSVVFCAPLLLIVCTLDSILSVALLL